MGIDPDPVLGWPRTPGFVCVQRARRSRDRTERRMLEEILLGNRSAVTAEEMCPHFGSVLQSTAASTSAATSGLGMDGGRVAQTAASPTPSNPRQSPSHSPAGWRCWPLYHLDLQSPTFHRQRLLQMQQELTEQQAAGQIEHFQRAHDAPEAIRSPASCRPAAFARTRFAAGWGGRSAGADPRNSPDGVGRASRPNTFGPSRRGDAYLVRNLIRASTPEGPHSARSRI